MERTTAFLMFNFTIYIYISISSLKRRWCNVHFDLQHTLSRVHWDTKELEEMCIQIFEVYLWLKLGSRLEGEGRTEGWLSVRCCEWIGSTETVGLGGMRNTSSVVAIARSVVAVGLWINKWQESEYGLFQWCILVFSKEIQGQIFN